MTPSARMHVAGQDYSHHQPNPRGLDWWRATAPVVHAFLSAEQQTLLDAIVAYATVLEDRAGVLAALSCVDYIVAFAEDTPAELIRQLRPEIFVVLLTCTIAALKVFAPIYVLTRGGPGGSTNVPSYYSFQNFFEKTQVGYGAAVATALTVLILLLTTVFLRVQNRGER